MFGSRWGLALAGLAGGFVSTRRPIAVRATKPRRRRALATSLAERSVSLNAANRLWHWVIVVGTWPLSCSGGAWPIVAAWRCRGGCRQRFRWRESRLPTDGGMLAGKRPFEPRHVLIFVGILGGIVLLSAMRDTCWAHAACRGCLPHRDWQMSMPPQRLLPNCLPASRLTTGLRTSRLRRHWLRIL